MAELNQKVQELAKAYKDAGITIDAETKTGKVAEDIYAKNLLDGLTPDIVQLVRQNDTLHLVAATKAIGEASLEACAKNKDLETVTTVVPMTGKDKMTIAYQHKKVEGVGEEAVTKHGSVRAKFDLYGEAGNRGQLKIAREELAAAALAKAGE